VKTHQTLLFLCIYQLAVADLREGLGDASPAPFFGKKNLRKGEKQAGKTKQNKTKKPAPSLPQGLNPPLNCTTNYWQVL